MKRRKIRLYVLVTLLLIAAGIGCYYWYVEMHPKIDQGGILVYEHRIIHSDQQKC